MYELSDNYSNTKENICIISYPMETLTITKENIMQSGLGCLSNPKHPGFQLKSDWLIKRFEEGWKLKLLRDNNKTIAYIEYTDGENAWRPVDAKGYLFIQCIWTFGKANLNKGYAGKLLEDCIEDARKKMKDGVAVVASDKSWMAGPDVFGKYGCQLLDKTAQYSLMVYKLSSNNRNPSFIDFKSRQKEYQGLHLLYAAQCPYIASSIPELKKTAKDMGFDLNIKELKSAEEVRNAPSGYGVYALIFNGKLLAEHYKSKTAFRNILKKLDA
jgi:hypothetical protein